MLKILTTIVLLITSNHTVAGSKCQYEWDALKSIQSKLRHRTTEYLRDKERIRPKNCTSPKTSTDLLHV